MSPLLCRPALVLSLAALGACDQPTAILLSFSADDETASKIASVRLIASAAADVHEQSWEVEGHLGTISLRPGTLSEDARIELHTVASLEDGTTVERRATVRFQPGEDIDRCVQFEASCTDFACPFDRDCRAGGCEPVREAPASCAPQACDAASTCDDGNENTADLCGDDGLCRHPDSADIDGDGHRSRQAGGDDCDDVDETIFPGADDPCDGVNQDCDEVLDGKVIARSEPARLELLRILPLEDRIVTAGVGVEDGSNVVTILTTVLEADGNLPVTDVIDGGSPALAWSSDDVLLLYRDGAGLFRVATVRSDGEVSTSTRAVFEADACAREQRPVLVVQELFAAAAFLDCSGDDLGRPVLSVTDLRRQQREPQISTFGEPGTNFWFPTVAPLGGWFMETWASDSQVQGIRTPNGIDYEELAEFAGAAPALVLTPSSIVSLFIDRASSALRAVRYDEAGDVAGRPAIEQPDVVFSGTFPGQGAALAYDDSTPLDPLSRNAVPYLVYGSDEAWSEAHVTPLLDANLRGPLGDVAYGPDGYLYYVGSPASTVQAAPVIVARLSCGSRSAN